MSPERMSLAGLLRRCCRVAAAVAVAVGAGAALTSVLLSARSRVADAPPRPARAEQPAQGGEHEGALPAAPPRRRGAARAVSVCDGGVAVWCGGGEAAQRCGRPCPADAPAAVRAERPSRVARGTSRDADWEAARERNAARAAAAPDDAVVFIGDSITESLVGTDMGRPGWVQRHGWVSRLPELFRWVWPKGVALGIGGDETSHLIARLLSGELDGMRGRAAAAVLLIGTNNLAIGCHKPPQVAEGVLAVARLLCRVLLPGAALLVLGLLPRRDCTYSLCWSGVPGCVPPAAAKCAAGNARACATPDPLVHWQIGGPKVNRAVAAGLPDACPRAEYVDCSRVVTDERGGVLRRMLPDLLHPSREGHAALWEHCIAPALRRVAPGAAPRIPANLSAAAALSEQELVMPEKKRKRRRR